MPLSELKQFRRVSLAKGQQKIVTFSVPVSELAKWDVRKNGWNVAKGTYKLKVGSHSRDARLENVMMIR